MKRIRSQQQLALSEKQLAANRANSRLSTGPKTEDGKRKFGLTARRHNLGLAPMGFPACIRQSPGERAGFRREAIVEPLAGCLHRDWPVELGVAPRRNAAFARQGDYFAVYTPKAKFGWYELMTSRLAAAGS